MVEFLFVGLAFGFSGASFALVLWYLRRGPHPPVTAIEALEQRIERLELTYLGLQKVLEALPDLIKETPKVLSETVGLLRELRESQRE